MRLLYPYGEEFTGKRAREVHSIHRAHSMAEAGVEVVFVLAESDNFKDAESLLKAFGLREHPKLKMVFLPRKIRIGPFQWVSTKVFYGALGRWLEQEEPFDLAYVIHLKGADYLQSHWSSLPVVFEAHEIFADSFPEEHAKHRRLQSLERRIYARSAAVVATSNYLLRSVQERYGLPRMSFVQPNSVSDEFFDVPLEGADPKRVIYVGSLQSWKGVDIAVEAMRLLPGHELHVFGGNIAGGPDNVKFHGFASHEELRPELARAALGVIPNRLAPRSSLYTFPMKLLEYAAAGRQVVASDLPVLRELELGDWAETVPAEAVEALAGAIEKTKMSVELRAAARQWARGFTWAKAAKTLGNYFEEVLAGQKSGDEKV